MKTLLKTVTRNQLRRSAVVRLSILNLTNTKMTKYKTITELAAAMKSGELPKATPCRPYPKGGYGWEFDKGVTFRYWPSDEDTDEEAEMKMDAAPEVFDLQAAFAEAGIDNGNDNSDAFAKLLLRELGCLA